MIGSTLDCHWQSAFRVEMKAAIFHRLSSVLFRRKLLSIGKLFLTICREKMYGSVFGGLLRHAEDKHSNVLVKQTRTTHFSWMAFTNKKKKTTTKQTKKEKKERKRKKERKERKKCTRQLELCKQEDIEAIEDENNGVGDGGRGARFDM